MGRTASEYQQMLQALLPPGSIWNREPDSTLGEVLLAEGDEFTRVESRMEDLIDERDPTTVTELLVEHEEDFGLPEDGEELGATTALRREQIHALLIARGQQDPAYFVSIAEGLGYTVTIQEHTPAWVGLATVGQPCGDQENLFYFTVLIQHDNDTVLNITKLISKINKYKPAHVIALFDFIAPAFGRAFGRSFDAILHYDGTVWPGSFSPDFSSAFNNNIEYDGVNYIGAFGYGFNLAFDRRSGGAFHRDEFGVGFTRPN